MPPAGVVVALDLSSVVGWCSGRPGGVVPAFGTWHLTERDLGGRYVGFENELIALLDRVHPVLVVMEAPLPASRQGNARVARQQLGLAAYTEGECWRRRIALREQDAGTVRKAVLGRGRFAGGSEEAKATVLAWCNRRGWSVPDHNAGDACVLWDFSCQ